MQTFYAVTAKWCGACQQWKSRHQQYQQSNELPGSAKKLMNVHLIVVDADDDAKNAEVAKYIQACSVIPTIFQKADGTAKPVPINGSATEFLDQFVRQVKQADRMAQKDPRQTFHADTLPILAAGYDSVWLGLGATVALAGLWLKNIQSP
jgi:hypothetical protein